MMSQVVKEQTGYAELFREMQRNEFAADPTWVQRLREDAFARFEELGFPSTSIEDWKYTNVAAIAKEGFEPWSDGRRRESNTAATELKRFCYEETRQSQLVFMNGAYRPDLSSLEALPAGVVAISLADALRSDTHAAVLRDKLARIADHRENAFAALNSAFVGNGVLVVVPKGQELAAPIHIVFISDSAASKQMSSPRLLYVGEQGSSATLIESYESADEDAAYLTNAVVEVSLDDSARLTHYKVQRESAAAFHIATTEASMARNSSYNTTTITLGARLSRHNVSVAFEGEGAECWVDGLYLVGNGQHTDTHSVIDHRQPHCISHQLYKGILDGKSRAVFNGKVFVREGAQQTDAMQTNKNLLLSPEARVDTKPQLEIFADDVKCAHGAAVGQIDDEELFYLETRGINPDRARNLLTYGFAEEVIVKIEVESIRAQLDAAVLNRLHADLEV